MVYLRLPLTQTTPPPHTHTPTPRSEFCVSVPQLPHLWENLILLCFLLSFPSNIPSSFYYYIQKKWQGIPYKKAEFFNIRILFTIKSLKGNRGMAWSDSMHYLNSRAGALLGAIIWHIYQYVLTSQELNTSTVLKHWWIGLLTPLVLFLFIPIIPYKMVNESQLYKYFRRTWTIRLHNDISLAKWYLRVLIILTVQLSTIFSMIWTYT